MVNKDKNSIRRIAMLSRDALSEAEKEKASYIMLENFSTKFHFRDKIIACYVAYNSEMNLESLIKKLSNFNEIALPIIDGKKIFFAKYKIGDELIKKKFGISEPKIQKKITPDIVITPLLAFDLQGHRIGYGRGYYDRFIALNDDKIFIGVAYEQQKIANIPIKKHDKKLNYIITDKESYSFVDNL